MYNTMYLYIVHLYVEEGGSDHVILPDPVLLPVESLSSYILRGYNVLKSFQ